MSKKEDWSTLLVRGMNLEDVIMRRGSFSVIKDPSFDVDLANNARVQSYKSLSFTALEPDSEDEGSDYAVIYLVSFGIRLIDQRTVPEGGDGDPDILIIIEGEFEATYNAKEKFPEGQLSTFGSVLVFKELWPYWREYVDQCSSRMDIEGFAMGSYPEPTYDDLIAAQEELDS
jgi:hypothetical protein